MNICLVNPPLKIDKSVGKVFVSQPLGLAYIAAVLEKEHNVCIIDATVEGWKNTISTGGQSIMGLSQGELKEMIKNFQPDIVGITVPFSVNAESAFTTATLVKSIDKNIITILGGPHPSVRPAQTLEYHSVDYVVIGEGENTILELVSEIQTRPCDTLKDVKGIGFKADGKIIITEPRPLIEDLDLLPLPARNLLPMEQYFAATEGGKSSRPIYTYHSRWASIMTSRGCPFKCNFCSIHLTMGRAFRARSPENVFQEIDHLVNVFQVKHINFEDDNLTFSRKRAYKICDLIIKNNLNITWSTPNGIRADIIDEELVKKMAQSGCRRVFVAPESGEQRVVTEIIGKNLDLKKIENAVKLLTRYNITVDGSFVIGSIGETKRDIWKTIKFALKLKRLGLNTAGFHIATPLYGTKLYQEAKEKGFLWKDISDEVLTTGRPLIETPDWTGEELRKLQGIANWLVNYSLKQKLQSIFRRWGQLGGYLKEIAREYLFLSRRFL